MNNMFTVEMEQSFNQFPEQKPSVAELELRGMFPYQLCEVAEGCVLLSQNIVDT